MPVISQYGGKNALRECWETAKNLKIKNDKLKEQNAKLKEQLARYKKYSELIRFLEEKGLSPEEAMEIIQNYLLEKALEEDEDFDELEPDMERILRWA